MAPGATADSSWHQRFNFSLLYQLKSWLRFEETHFQLRGLLRAQAGKASLAWLFPSPGGGNGLGCLCGDNQLV